MNANEKLTALADEVRELSGTTTTKSIDAMTSDVDAANMEIAEQTELLGQIVAALEGKAAGGATVEDLDAELTEYASLNTEFEEVVNSLPNAGGSGGGNIETCTLTIVMDGLDYHPFCFITVLDNAQLKILIVNSSATFTNVIKNSSVIVMVPELVQHWEANFPRNGIIEQQYYDSLLLDDNIVAATKYSIADSGSITFF